MISALGNLAPLTFYDLAARRADDWRRARAAYEADLPRRLRDAGLARPVELERIADRYPEDGGFLTATRRWLARPGRGSLLFVGAPGRGKTHCAQAILTAWILRGRSGHYRTWDGIIKAEKSGRPESLIGHGLLVVDQLNGVAGWEELFVELHDAREAGGRPTIWITNRAPETWAKAGWDEMVRSRLLARGVSRVAFGGGDRRR